MAPGVFQPAANVQAAELVHLQGAKHAQPAAAASLDSRRRAVGDGPGRPGGGDILEDEKGPQAGWAEAGTEVHAA